MSGVMVFVDVGARDESETRWRVMMVSVGVGARKERQGRRLMW